MACTHVIVHVNEAVKMAVSSKADTPWHFGTGYVQSQIDVCVFLSMWTLIIGEKQKWFDGWKKNNSSILWKNWMLSWELGQHPSCPLVVLNSGYHIPKTWTFSMVVNTCLNFVTQFYGSSSEFAAPLMYPISNSWCSETMVLLSWLYSSRLRLAKAKMRS